MKKLKLTLDKMCCENAVKRIFFELHSINGVEETHFDLASRSVLIYLQAGTLPAIESKYQDENLINKGCKQDEKQKKETTKSWRQ